MCLRQSGAVHRGAVGQPSSSSMAQAIMSLPPTNLIISLHLKRIQFRYYCGRQQTRFFRIAPESPLLQFFSVDVLPLPTVQDTVSQWVDCMRGLKSSCEHMVPPHSAHVVFTYKTIPSHFSIWMARSPCRSQCIAH